MSKKQRTFLRYKSQSRTREYNIHKRTLEIEKRNFIELRFSESAFSNTSKGFPINEEMFMSSRQVAKSKKGGLVINHSLSFGQE